jgi:hypothetical protein
LRASKDKVDEVFSFHDGENEWIVALREFGLDQKSYGEEEEEV